MGVPILMETNVTATVTRGLSATRNSLCSLHCSLCFLLGTMFVLGILCFTWGWSLPGWALQVLWRESECVNQRDRHWVFGGGSRYEDHFVLKFSDTESVTRWGCHCFRGPATSRWVSLWFFWSFIHDHDVATPILGMTFTFKEGRRGPEPLLCCRTTNAFQISQQAVAYVSLARTWLSGHH